jgi:outer membrane cobalamin receptor
VRALGAQFEDDRNELELGSYAAVDAYASRMLRRGIQVFFAIENILNAEYDVGRTPLRTIGWPRAVRGGVRLFLP